MNSATTPENLPLTLPLPTVSSKGVTGSPAMEPDYEVIEFYNQDNR